LYVSVKFDFNTILKNEEDGKKDKNKPNDINRGLKVEVV